MINFLQMLFVAVFENSLDKILEDSDCILEFCTLGNRSLYVWEVS